MVPEVGGDAPSADEGRPSVVTATRRALDEVGRADSPAGAQALLLAHLLESGGYNAAGAAALARAHRDAVQEALRGAPKPGDRLDELLQRRAARG